MTRSILGRGNALTLAIVPIAIAAAMAIATATTVHAAAAKPKPVIGELVLAGAGSSPVTAFAWNVSAETSFTKGSGAAVGKPNPAAVRVTKQIDPSSVPALKKIAGGSSFPTAALTVTFGKGKGAATMVYEFQLVFITDVTQSAADGLVTEDVSFVFKTVTWTFTDPSGNVTTGSWDVPSGDVS